MIEFTDERLERYSRHILLKDVGIEGQMKLFGASVLIIGAGGLGSPAALYLAAAGIGKIGIVDGDRVELSNLQRQVIHLTRDLGRLKAVSAAEKMNLINPDIEVEPLHELVRADNARQILDGYQFVIDGTDNFPAKFLINDACVLAGVPFSHGGLLRFNGQTMTVLPGQSACYRCVFHDMPPKGAVPSCSEAGVLGAVAGILGTIQATEALKFFTGVGTLLTDSLLTFDSRDMNFRKVSIRKNPRCPVCGESPRITGLIDYEQPVCELKQVTR